jgi:hypothetical protein
MSATLGMLLRQMRPDWSIVTYERADKVATESSDPWNNAGTGHAALCELNYTPELPDGSIDLCKAVTVFQQFHESRLFWSALVERGILPAPEQFIRPVPHMSYVSGDKDVDFLRKRYDALRTTSLFDSLVLAEDAATFEDWVPLMMAGRDRSEPVAMTRSDAGTDVSFGDLTRLLFDALQRDGVEVATNREDQWPLAGDRPESHLGRIVEGDRAVRLHRRWRPCHPPPAEERYRGGQKLRRLPSKWPVPAVHESGRDREAQCQGLREVAGECSTDVHAAP